MGININFKVAGKIQEYKAQDVYPLSCTLSDFLSGFQAVCVWQIVMLTCSLMKWQPEI